jgi:hypothetical protein
MSTVSGKVLADVTHKEVPSGTVNSSNTSFTLTYAPTSADSLSLYLDGLLLNLTTDYSVSGTTITMVVAPAFGQGLYATYQYKS